MLIQNLSPSGDKNCGIFHSHYHRHFTPCSINATEKHAYIDAASKINADASMRTDNKGSISRLPCAAGWPPAHVLTSIFTFHTCKHADAKACQHIHIHNSSSPGAARPRRLIRRGQNAQSKWKMHAAPLKFAEYFQYGSPQWKDFLMRSRQICQFTNGIPNRKDSIRLNSVLVDLGTH